MTPITNQFILQSLAHSDSFKDREQKYTGRPVQVTPSRWIFFMDDGSVRYFIKSGLLYHTETDQVMTIEEAHRRPKRKALGFSAGEALRLSKVSTNRTNPYPFNLIQGAALKKKTELTLRASLSPSKRERLIRIGYKVENLGVDHWRISWNGR